MNQLEFFESIENTFSTCLETAKKKNQDYAGDKDPFANFSRVETFGICTVEQGILVRITDKLARVSNLIGGKNPAVADESVDDTLLDTINYLAILKAYRDGKSKSCEQIPFAETIHVPPVRSINDWSSAEAYNTWLP